VIDLPGTYSLTSYSPEERVTRSALLDKPISTVVNVVDASNLRRGLYLTLQLLEMGSPVLLALNMMDVAGLSGDIGNSYCGDDDANRRRQNEAIDAIALRKNDDHKSSELYSEVDVDLQRLVATLVDDAIPGRCWLGFAA